jgi:CHAT domain-containing protein
VVSGPQTDADIVASLRELLRELENAQDRDDTRRAVRAAAAAVTLRLCTRLARRGDALSPLDYALFDRLGQDLLKLDAPGAALRVFAAARAFSTRPGDVYSMRFFELRGVHACIATLDFEVAGLALASCLALPQDRNIDRDVAIRAARELVVPNTAGRSADEVRVFALWTLGRFWASIGRLGDADVALGRALEASSHSKGTLVDRAELAVFRAEVRLDRGDFAGFTELRLAQGSERQGGRWELLEAIRLRDQGELSGAVQILQRLEGETDGQSSCRRAARLQRVQALSFLNRLDEAEHLLDLVAHDAGHDPSPGEQLRALLRARRRAAVETPPTARETLWGQPFEALSTTSTSSVRGGGIGRTRERVLDDWARFAAGVQIAMDRDDLVQAQRAFEIIDPWARGIDSPLLHARRARLDALVAAASGDHVRVDRSAREARSRFRDLGMPTGEWSSLAILGDALRHTGTPEVEVAEVWRSADRIQAAIVGKLDRADRAFYRLNKWSHLERSVGVMLDEFAAGSKNQTTAEVERLLDQILTLRRWDEHDGGNGNSDPPGSRAKRDVFSWVGKRLGSKRRRTALFDETQVRSRWMSSDTAVWTLIVLPDRLESILCTRAGTHVIRPEPRTTRAEVWRLCEDVLHEQESLPAGTWLGPSAERLANALGLDRMCDLLPSSIRVLAIQPDGLYHVPFASLPLQGRPLIERCLPVFLPRVQWLARWPSSPRSYRRGLQVGVGLSDLAPDRPLPHAETEVVDVVDGGAHTIRVSTALKGEFATRAAVVASLATSDFAHFACHGEFDVGTPEASGLLMRDGWITAEDFSRLDLSAFDFFVLCACWSGDVRVLPGGEAVGLPTAILDSGARTVVTSIWPVRDASAADYLRGLYTSIAREGLLHGFQRNQVTGVATRHPRDWSGYVVYVNGIVPSRLRKIMWFIEKAIRSAWPM